LIARLSAARLHAIAALREQTETVRMRRHTLALLATATALYKVDIHIAGRAPSPKSWEAAAVDEYAKRLRGQLELKTTWHKSGDQLEKSIAKMEAVLCLSPEGKRVDSEGFSKLLYDSLDQGGSRLCLCIGPAEGFTDELRGRASLLSLSDLTLPHQLARVVLAEQVYRAAEIRRGSGYHK
jgi:23S rRNA (pseudouridine1915-N3)-methyltransferase